MFTGIGEAEAARQIAAAGDFQYHGAGSLAMFGTKPAIKGASLLFMVSNDFRVGGNLGTPPAAHQWRPFPDQSPELPMRGALFFQKDFIFLRHPSGGYAG